MGKHGRTNVDPFLAGITSGLPILVDDGPDNWRITPMPDQDIAAILTQYLDNEERADLHLALMDRQYHLEGLMAGNPLAIGASLRRLEALHKRLFHCGC